MAIEYGQQLHQTFGFKLRIVGARRTKLGDFRVYPGGLQQITVNATLNPYAFLITYVHEVAHAAVYQAQYQAGRRIRGIKPHGPDWQRAFRDLMEPMLNETVFPPAILHPLRAYLQKPAATTSGCPLLMNALRLADPVRPVLAGQLSLADVTEGQSFVFQKKVFIRGALRRTRIVCKETTSGRLYAILAQAEVMIHD